MKVPFFRSLTALGAVAALAGFSHAPTTVAPIPSLSATSYSSPRGLDRIDQVNLPFTNKLSGLGAGSPSRLLTSSLALPLSVSLTCGGHAAYCYATAMGGTYVGHSFSWTAYGGHVWEGGYADGTSYAEFQCAEWNDSVAYVYVEVTDDSNAYASASLTIPCR
ncbi:MAG TPA: hypothetical protein VLK84_06250 [Longimicrobium sp.]|nr:hypothetical protein [Longimicrobium sp.]